MSDVGEGSVPRMMIHVLHLSDMFYRVNKGERGKATCASKEGPARCHGWANVEETQSASTLIIHNTKTLKTEEIDHLAAVLYCCKGNHSSHNVTRDTISHCPDIKRWLNISTSKWRSPFFVSFCRPSRMPDEGMCLTPQADPTALNMQGQSCQTDLWIPNSLESCSIFHWSWIFKKIDPRQASNCSSTHSLVYYNHWCKRKKIMWQFISAWNPSHVLKKPHKTRFIKLWVESQGEGFCCKL